MTGGAPSADVSPQGRTALPGVRRQGDGRAVRPALVARRSASGVQRGAAGDAGRQSGVPGEARDRPRRVLVAPRADLSIRDTSVTGSMNRPPRPGPRPGTRCGPRPAAEHFDSRQQPDTLADPGQHESQKRYMAHQFTGGVHNSAPRATNWVASINYHDRLCDVPRSPGNRAPMEGHWILDGPGQPSRDTASPVDNHGPGRPFGRRRIPGLRRLPEVSGLERQNSHHPRPVDTSSRFTGHSPAITRWIEAESSGFADSALQQELRAPLRSTAQPGIV